MLIVAKGLLVSTQILRNVTQADQDSPFIPAMLNFLDNVKGLLMEIDGLLILPQRQISITQVSEGATFCGAIADFLGDR